MLYQWQSSFQRLKGRYYAVIMHSINVSRMARFPVTIQVNFSCCTVIWHLNESFSWSYLMLLSPRLPLHATHYTWMACVGHWGLLSHCTAVEPDGFTWVWSCLKLQHTKAYALLWQKYVHTWSLHIQGVRQPLCSYNPLNYSGKAF